MGKGSVETVLSRLTRPLSDARSKGGSLVWDGA